MPESISELLKFLQKGNAAMEHLLSDAAEKWQLSVSELQIILFLDRMPQLDTARDVTLHCGMSKASVSGNVLRLATRGLLTVDVDLRDRRFQHLTLTEQASPIIQDTGKRIMQLDAQLHAVLSEEESDLLRALLARINENIAEI